MSGRGQTVPPVSLSFASFAMTAPASRYTPVAIALHWAIALAIFAMIRWAGG